MSLDELLNSYNQIGYQPLESPQQEEEFIIEESPLSKVRFYNSFVFPTKGAKGTVEFEQAYDNVEKRNPEARKYRTFLTKIAKVESGFNKSIQNRAGAPAYGYFQFMQDGKKWNNISKYAGVDINTFRQNPEIQIEAAIKLAKSFENQFSKEDKRLAKEKGYTLFGLLGGAWLGGAGGVRKYLRQNRDTSDKHWGGTGTSVGARMRAFNFKYGGVL